MIETREYMHDLEATDRYTVYGNFIDRFREDAKTKEVRQYLIKDRPELDDKYPIDAAVLAAVVEVFVKEYNLEMPNWVMDKKYILKEPYFDGVELPEYIEFLKETSLPEFAKRNIFLGDNCMNRA